jgi:hypothetical protein
MLDFNNQLADDSLNETYLQGLRDLKYITLDKKKAKEIFIGSYDTVAMVKMVKRCYTSAVGKRHPYPIAAVVNRILYWHEWSLSRGNTRGEFYKSITGWQKEMEVSRTEVESAEEFLIDLGALKTENRTHIGGIVKFWILSKERLSYMLNLFMIAEAISLHHEEVKQGSEWGNLLLSVIHDLVEAAEESHYFKQGLVNLGLWGAFEFVENDPSFDQNDDRGGMSVQTRGMSVRADPLSVQTYPLSVQTSIIINRMIDTDNRTKNDKSFSIKIEKGRFQDGALGDASASPSGTPPEETTGLGQAQSGQTAQGDSPTGHPPARLALLDGDGSKLPRDVAGADQNLAEPILNQISAKSAADDAGYRENIDAAERDRGYPVPKPSFGTTTPKPVPNATQGNLKRLRASDEELQFLPVIEAWNSLPEIPDSGEFRSRKFTKHSFDYSGYVSKTVKSILERLVVASHGETLDRYPTITPWSDIELNDDLLHAPIPVDGFKEILGVYRQYFEPGKGVADKLKLETSLYGFLGCYTVRRRGQREGYFEPRSWFWEVLHRGRDVPAIINYSHMEQRVDKEFPEILTKLKTILASSNSEKGNWDQRIRAITARLLHAYEAMYGNTLLLYEHSSKYPEWLEAMKSFPAFVDIFVEFVNSYGFDDLKPGHFDPQKKMFRAFITYAREKIGIELDPSETTAKTLMMNRAVKRYAAKDILRSEEGIQIWYSQSEMDRVNAHEVNPWWNLKPLA